MASADCQVLNTALNVNLGANCCESGIATCDSAGRIVNVNAGCTGIAQPWTGGPFPQGLEQFTSLQVLFFDDCKLTGPLPDIWAAFPALYELHLQGNNLQGPLPTSIESLVSMEFFHIQGNNFVGPLPSTVSGMTSIQVA
ncbi:hypothetical protein BC830DRAFT_1108837 [Chytriomyces sp. MP71]|nr:hypothetical protein BC830DRAFT_1108837 [Chytriomyces sp. MP71]